MGCEGAGRAGMGLQNGVEGFIGARSFHIPHRRWLVRVRVLHLSAGRLYLIMIIYSCPTRTRRSTPVETAMVVISTQS